MTQDRLETIRKMRPPFWEVSLFSLEPGQPIMIETIVCFIDSVAMRKYVLEQRAQSPALLMRTVYRASLAPRQLEHAIDGGRREGDSLIGKNPSTRG